MKRQVLPDFLLLFTHKLIYFHRKYILLPNKAVTPLLLWKTFSNMGGWVGV